MNGLFNCQFAGVNPKVFTGNVQLGADYSVSVESTKRVAEGSEAAKELFNAEYADEVGFGSSSTQVAENLARAIETDFKEGDEIVITTEHEGQRHPSTVTFTLYAPC